MTLDWLFAAAPQRRLIPGGRFRGTTPVLLAIMTFVTMIVGAAGLALSNAAGAVATGVETRYAVPVPLGASLGKVIAAARSSSGVLQVKAVPEKTMRETLERWLGPASEARDLPVPSLVTLDIASGADRRTIAQRIERAAPGARLLAYEEALDPLLRSMRALQWLALALVVLMAAATAAVVVLAARGALDTHRSAIEVMHGIGSTDLQLAHLFQRKIALDAFAGAFAGSAAAGAILLFLSTGGSLVVDLVGAAPLDVTDIILLILLPLALVMLATWVARLAVLAALRQSL
jgi:cell division transport system permease protein